MENEELERLFERDVNGEFIRLIIPANEPTSQYSNELNLIGKKIKDCTIDESIRIKVYMLKKHYYNINEELLMTKDEVKYLFEKDEDETFIRLVIPSTDENGYEMDLRGKKPLDFTKDEVITMKKYNYHFWQESSSIKND